IFAGTPIHIRMPTKISSEMKTQSVAWLVAFMGWASLAEGGLHRLLDLCAGGCAADKRLDDAVGGLGRNGADFAHGLALGCRDRLFGLGGTRRDSGFRPCTLGIGIRLGRIARLLGDRAGIAARFRQGLFIRLGG